MSDMHNKPRQGGGVGRNPGREGDLSNQAKTLGRDLKTTAADLADDVSRAAKDQARELGTAAKDLATGAADKVTSAMSEQKTAGANYIGSIAQAVNRAAGEFDEKIPQAAHYIRQAADQLENVAQAVRERNMRELAGEVQDFARRQPTLFFGGAVILGFAALRFFKSSAANSDRTSASSRSYNDESSLVPRDNAFTQRRAS